jgi:glutamate/tyrosine decarboxylase-like PLP-dependent enzyme
MLDAFDEDLAFEGESAETVVRTLAQRAAPGLMAMGSGRFHGWVIGATLPAAMGADLLVSAWEQNAGMT